MHLFVLCCFFDALKKGGLNSICKMTINAGKDVSEDLIANISFASACEKMTPNDVSKCDRFSKKLLFRMIKSVNTSFICSYLLDKDSILSYIKYLNDIPDFTTREESLKVGQKDACQYCKDLYSYLAGVARKKVTSRTIIDIFRKISPKNAFVDKYLKLDEEFVSLIIKDISVEGDPHQICSQIGFCDSKEL